jgi:hypothetical protein
VVAITQETVGLMIDKREILEAASSFSLLPSIVEKDYVLGWILAGINAHDELGESWVFKGGTCLKKCYFETYRFSEDLDFTLRNEEHLDEEFLRTAFEEVISWVTDLVSIFPPTNSNSISTTTPADAPTAKAKFRTVDRCRQLRAAGPRSSSTSPRMKGSCFPLSDARYFIRTATDPKEGSGRIATPMRKPSEKNCARSENARGLAIFTTW